MKSYQVTVFASVHASSEKVYAILADYHEGHPRILPKPYFSALQVIRGGVGAGTLIRFQMRVMGRTSSFHAAITEPQPGRVLVETEQTGKFKTIFAVQPSAKGEHAVVTITTILPARDGVAGMIERLLTSLFLRRVYVQELKLLAALSEMRNLISATKRHSTFVDEFFPITQNSKGVIQ